MFAVLATYNLSSMFTLSGLVVSMASVVMILLSYQSCDHMHVDRLSHVGVSLWCQIRPLIVSVRRAVSSVPINKASAHSSMHSNCPSMHVASRFWFGFTFIFSKRIYIGAESGLAMAGTFLGLIICMSHTCSINL